MIDAETRQRIRIAAQERVASWPPLTPKQKATIIPILRESIRKQRAARQQEGNN